MALTHSSMLELGSKIPFDNIKTINSSGKYIGTNKTICITPMPSATKPLPILYGYPAVCKNVFPI